MEDDPELAEAHELVSMIKDSGEMLLGITNNVSNSFRSCSVSLNPFL
jgi:hypothetical protein